MLTAWVLAERSTRFWGYVDHHQKGEDKTHHEAQDFRPASVSHPHHLLAAKSAPLKTPFRAFLALLPCVSSPSKAKGFAGAPFGKEVANRHSATAPQSFYHHGAVFVKPSRFLPPPLRQGRRFCFSSHDLPGLLQRQEPGHQLPHLLLREPPHAKLDADELNHCRSPPSWSASPPPGRPAAPPGWAWAAPLGAGWPGRPGTSPRFL